MVTGMRSLQHPVKPIHHAKPGSRYVPPCAACFSPSLALDDAQRRQPIFRDSYDTQL
ncbi:unnamed protein product [Mycena citricolor]|uniref:Uncharacterized protein n=1 Tax=Mycena citricolor TaxID=2018698 RepID=A0AAD2H2W6_9AGAR|nr:unnamed protein product [Mycena citricolor]